MRGNFAAPKKKHVDEFILHHLSLVSGVAKAVGIARIISPYFSLFILSQSLLVNEVITYFNSFPVHSHPLPSFSLLPPNSFTLGKTIRFPSPWLSPTCRPFNTLPLRRFRIACRLCARPSRSTRPAMSSSASSSSASSTGRMSCPFSAGRVVDRSHR